MKVITKIMTVAACAALTINAAFAVPAKRSYFTVVQPDGTELTIRKSGDERLHFQLTDDDKLVVRDADGQYSYARLDADGAVVSTGVKAVNAASRPVSHEYLTTGIETIDRGQLLRKRASVTKLHTLADDYTTDKPKRLARRNTMHRVKTAQNGTVTDYPQKGLGRFTSTFPATGKIKGLVILVAFADQDFNTAYTTSAHDYFNDLLNKPGFNEFGGTGSAADYYRDQSMGQFDPEFTLVGPVKLTRKTAYYGGNDTWGNDKAPEQMVIDACRAIDDQVNFADYDNDGDGFVDFVFVFYAGQGEASYGDEDTIWPHSWNLASGGKSLRLDGVSIDKYACTNEWQMAMPDGMGTFVHEFSHVMGLPDLYVTSGNGSHTPGAYSIMDYGPYNNNSRTPPAYSAYERNAMGWLQPILLDGARSVTLDHILDSNDACLVATDRDSEFFLFENRQQQGWDTYIPGHGMLVWHIDFVQNIFDQNIVNNKASHSYVDIVEANGTTSSTNPRIMAGYPFPGTGGVTEFTATGKPAFVTWKGDPIYLPVTEIAEDAETGQISFSVDGGGLPAPTAVDATDKGTDWFIAAWNPIEGATDYQLTVSAMSNDVPVVDETAQFSGTAGDISLPAGWSTTATDVFTNENAYSSAPSSLKLDTDGQTVDTRTYDSDITSLRFWYEGLGALRFSSRLTVEGYDGQRYVPITTVTPASVNKSAVVEITKMPQGIRQISFSFSKDAGNIALDDVQITTGGVTDNVLPAYDHISTGGATTMLVTGLPDDYSRFSYTVIATDGLSVSRESNSVTVQLDRGGVDDIIADSDDATGVTVNGRTVTVSTTAQRVLLYNAVGVLVDSVRVSDGQAVITAPTAGLYIVHADGRGIKVALH